MIVLDPPLLIHPCLVDQFLEFLFSHRISDYFSEGGGRDVSGVRGVEDPVYI